MQAVLSITFLMLGCLQRLVCSSNADVEQLAALGPLVSEFPCNGSSWLKMSHMVHHGYLFDMRFRYNLGDYRSGELESIHVLPASGCRLLHTVVTACLSHSSISIIYDHLCIHLAG